MSVFESKNLICIVFYEFPQTNTWSVMCGSRSEQYKVENEAEFNKALILYSTVIHYYLTLTKGCHFVLRSGGDKRSEIKGVKILITGTRREDILTLF